MGSSSKQVSSDGHGRNDQGLRKGGNLELEKPPSLKCPRCDSSNTKFCYYNNYNKSQPRHFCKACKRHWTRGGTLRNVPVGGGRKNKRLKTSDPATRTASKSTTAALFSGISCNNNLTTQPQRPRLGFPLGGDTNISAAFYQTLGRQPQTSLPQSLDEGNSGIFLGSTLSLFHNDQETQFRYSNLGIFESNLCSISSNQSPNRYNNYTGDTANGFDETGVHSLNTSISSSSMSDHHQTWEIPSNCSVMDLSNNWGWDDFDNFVSVQADLSIPWDDAEIKP